MNLDLDKIIDPYRAAKQNYENTITKLDQGISTAMRSLFDNGDLRLIDRKVIAIYGIRLVGNKPTSVQSVPTRFNRSLFSKGYFAM